MTRAARVGVDVIPVCQVQDAVDRFGPRYLHRLFTNHELESCGPENAPAYEGLAARFAAKEAALKVLRVDGTPPPWTDLEVRRHPGGWCEMVLTGIGADMAEAQGICHPMSLSLTHEAGLAIAVIITFSSAERRSGTIPSG